MTRPHAVPASGKGQLSSAFRAQQAHKAARRAAKVISDRLTELRQAEKRVRTARAALRRRRCRRARLTAAAAPPSPTLPSSGRAQERGERLAAKRKLKAENEFKSAQTQEISDPTKLKRMSKKQLRAIKRVRVNDDGVRELVPAYS